MLTFLVILLYRLRTILIADMRLAGRRHRQTTRRFNNRKYTAAGVQRRRAWSIGSCHGVKCAPVVVGKPLSLCDRRQAWRSVNSLYTPLFTITLTGHVVEYISFNRLGYKILSLALKIESLSPHLGYSCISYVDRQYVGPVLDWLMVRRCGRHKWKTSPLLAHFSRFDWCTPRNAADF